MTEQTSPKRLISVKQREARVHNWNKLRTMIMHTHCTKMMQDKKLTEQQKQTISDILTLLEGMLSEWGELRK